jgi:hypothetical protein
MSDLGINYKYEISDREVFITELNTLNQIKLLKCITFEENAFDKYKVLVESLDKCINGRKERCTYIDLFLLYIKTRIVSIGSNIDLKVLLNGNREAEYKLDINNVYYSFINLILKHKPNTFESKDLTIVCDIPNACDIFHIIEIINDVNDISAYVPLFVQKIIINNQDIEYDLKTFSLEERNILCASLSVHLYSKVVEYIQATQKKFKSIVLYKAYNNTDIHCDILGADLFKYIEFLYSSDLATVHEQVYTLTSIGNIDYKAVMGMCELERELYISFIRKQYQRTNNAGNQDKDPINVTDYYNSLNSQ